MDLQKILNTKHLRHYYFSKNFYAFCLYYFFSAFVAKCCSFHKDYTKALQNGENIFCVGFRELAKTVFLKYYIIRCIVYQKKRFICFYGFEQVSASSKLFDIIIQLQSNKLLIRDFGHLYTTGPKSEKVSTKKTISEFITENGVKVQAFGLGESLRGKVFGTIEGEFRPDLLCFDDIDVDKSVQNSRVIDKNYDMLRGEIFGAASATAQIVFLGNVIKSDGIVQRMKVDYKHRKQFWIAIGDTEDTLSWPERYSWEGAEGKINLKQIRLNQGTVGFNKNYRLVPYNGESIIPRDNIHMTIPQHHVFVKIVLGIDPAISEKTLSDHCAFVVTGHTKDGKKIVLSAVKLEGKEKNEDNIINTAYKLYKDFQCNIAHFESVAFQKLLGNKIKAKGVALKLITPHTDKVTRFLEHESDFNKGNIMFCPGTERLIDQLESFPNGSHDDGVDAMVYSFVKPKYDASLMTGSRREEEDEDDDDD